MDYLLAALKSSYFYIGVIAALIIRFFITNCIKAEKRKNIFKIPICEKIYDVYKDGKNINIKEISEMCNIHKEVSADGLWLKFAYWLSYKYLSYDYDGNNERQIIHSMFNTIFSSRSAEKLIALDNLLNLSPLLYLDKNGDLYHHSSASKFNDSGASADIYRDECMDQIVTLIEISYKNQKPTSYLYK